MPRPTGAPAGATEHCGPWVRGPYQSIQVNVDAKGCNIVGDAANEPSIAIDPTNPSRIVIGWRQFDTVESNFRQAGWAYSHDAGNTWTFPGVLEPGVFRSDPVLDADADGNIYFYSLTEDFTCDLYKSVDGGVSWLDPVPAFGGDKAWIAVDRTGGIGHGNLYFAWDFYGCCGDDVFTRSVDGGATFSNPVAIPEFPIFGTLAVGPDGELYVSGFGGGGVVVAKSTNAQDPDQTPTFDFANTAIDCDAGECESMEPCGPSPNPGGLLGQVWVASDHSYASTRGNLYVLFSGWDLRFSRSTDGGVTWSRLGRISDDPLDSGAWQWFGTMSVAPNGRIDVVWNDTRNAGCKSLSELFYTFSMNGGTSWSKNIPVSPAFNSRIGWPQQDKIGDYYDMISDDGGVNIAYAATFNGEQDVYFLRIEVDCNDNGISDRQDVADGTSEDCDGNSIPDECQPDCNSNGTADTCDIAAGTSADCNRNFNPDECDPDFDGDGLTDTCDPDIDDDRILNDADACDFTPSGAPVKSDGSPMMDTGGDCDIDLSDYWRFMNCLAQSGPATSPSQQACLSFFDPDQNHHVDLADFAGFMTGFTGIR